MSCFFVCRNNYLKFWSLNCRLRYNTCSCYQNFSNLSRRSNRDWNGLGLDNICCEKWHYIRLSYCFNWNSLSCKNTCSCCRKSFNWYFISVGNSWKNTFCSKGTIRPAFIGFIYNVLSRSSTTYLNIRSHWGNSFPSFLKLLVLLYTPMMEA